MELTNEMIEQKIHQIEKKLDLAYSVAKSETGALRAELLGMIEPKYEVGKWYKDPQDGMDYLVNYQLGPNCYGIFRREWNMGGWEFPESSLKNLGYLEATPSEVLEALQKEAVKRGLVAGAKVDRSNLAKFAICDDVVVTLFPSEYRYSEFSNALQIGKHVIFHKGFWAIPVKEKTTEDYAKEFGEFVATSIPFDTHEDDFRNFIKQNNLKITPND